LSLFLTPCFAEEKAKPSVALETGAALEQALAKIEEKREAERKKLAAQLSAQMQQAVDKWIAQKSNQRNSELHKLVEQNWEKLALKQSISPVPYDYYLRGFVLTKGPSDITRTDSLLANPYKGKAVVVEKLYVEKYHSPDISSIDPYFFTVTGNFTLAIEFGQAEPLATVIDYKVVDIENDSPAEIKRLRI
jgi:hypothetical protein